MKAGIGMIETGMKTQKMLVASSSVIGKRTAAMAYAARNPAGGDYPELGRMVPEKVSAFSEAGRIVTREWAASLLDASHHAHHVYSVMLRGRVPSAGEMLALGTRTAAHGTRVDEDDGRWWTRACADPPTGNRQRTPAARSLAHAKPRTHVGDGAVTAENSGSPCA